MKSYIVQTISKLVNFVFVEGVYPSCLKLTKVLPIFKLSSKQFQVITDQFHSCQVLIRALKRLCIVVYVVF